MQVLFGFLSQLFPARGTAQFTTEQSKTPRRPSRDEEMYRLYRAPTGHSWSSSIPA